MIEDLAIEPVEQPDGEKCRDALQKGLGRAVLWAQDGRWKDRDILLQACLHDQRYDRQCEESRGKWLWGIMEATGTTDAFREPILAAAGSIEDDVAAVQLCEFCVEYARRGDERFRDRLRAIVAERPVSDCPMLGVDGLIELAGEAGFVVAAERRGSELHDREWEKWEDGYLIEKAVKLFGRERVAALLHERSSSSEAIARFLRGWESSAVEPPSEPWPSHADRMRRISLDEVIQAAEDGGNLGGYFRGWGMYASEDDLRAIHNRMTRCASPEVLEKYLRVFSNRTMPRFDESLIGLLNHESDNVRSRAFTAISLYAHPAIRKFAIENIGERFSEFRFLELFIRNYQPGDEDILLHNLELPVERDSRHWILMDLKEILEKNPIALCRELGLCIYFGTPCGNCRSDAASLLISRAVAPDWLIEECRWDCDSNTRELAQSELW